MRKAASAPLVALVAMILIWGYSWILMKIGLRYAHPFDFAALRVWIGASVLFGIVKAQGGGLRLPSYRMAFVLGTLQVSLFLGLAHYALLNAGPGKTSVLVFTMPFWVIIFAHAILHERMHGLQWLAVGLAFGGLVLIVAPWRLTSLTGSLLAVAAGATWGLAAVLSKRWPTRAAPMIFTAWQLLFGGVWLTALAWIHPHPPIDWTREFVVALLLAAIAGTGIGWWLWTYVLAHTSAGIAGLNSLGIPVVAVLSSALQLGERPSARDVAGMLAIGAALVLLALLGMRRRS